MATMDGEAARARVAELDWWHTIEIAPGVVTPGGRRVCRGQLILLDTVSRPLEPLPAPLARLDARRDGGEWFVFNRRGLRKALELSGWLVEETTPVLRGRAGRAAGPARTPRTSRPTARHRSGTAISSRGSPALHSRLTRASRWPAANRRP